MRATANRCPAGSRAKAATGRKEGAANSSDTGLEAGSSLRTRASQGSPRRIQSRRVWICPGANCFRGGMCGSAPRRTTSSSRLSFGRPSITTGPSSLPLSTCSRVSNESPAFCLVSPWQEKHSSRSKTTALRPSGSPEPDEVAAADSNSTEAQRAASQNPSRLGMLWITGKRSRLY